MLQILTCCFSVIILVQLFLRFIDPKTFSTPVQPCFLTKFNLAFLFLSCIDRLHLVVNLYFYSRRHPFIVDLDNNILSSSKSVPDLDNVKGVS